ncbi:hypothetical protein EAH76_17590 [Sphingomonas glacialis]|uniref:Uncharacterized protein n=1 Tax=Sphingomonas glacialis TaxID=658225 RepID=A0A502FKC4_9SPHN|nr:hypothetical protein EAH76_17590 [Sphingomonas glacialis]
MRRARQAADLGQDREPQRVECGRDRAVRGGDAVTGNDDLYRHPRESEGPASSSGVRARQRDPRFRGDDGGSV